ncbi:MAG: hypothetical protein ABIK56_00850 [candidate division WOR-3 bacterium]
MKNNNAKAVEYQKLVVSELRANLPVIIYGEIKQAEIFDNRIGK